MINKYLELTNITEAWLYEIAMNIYMEYKKDNPPLTFLEWCQYKFDSIEDPFLSWKSQ